MLYKGSSEAGLDVPGWLGSSQPGRDPTGLERRHCAMVAGKEASASVHWRHAGHATTLTMDHLLGFQQLVEGDEAHGVAALV